MALIKAFLQKFQYKFWIILSIIIMMLIFFILKGIKDHVRNQFLYQVMQNEQKIILQQIRIMGQRPVSYPDLQRLFETNSY